MTTEVRYFAADAEYQAELTRRRIGEAECDPFTIRYLLRLGVGNGWRCLEVGAGAGSIVRWLSDRVGANGLVVAADINTRFLEDLTEPNIEIGRSDITHDEPEAGAYDLVHCRWLLMHLDQPAMALQRMARALRPGGWLLVEEVDARSMVAIDSAHPLADGFNATTQKRIRIISGGSAWSTYLHETWRLIDGAFVEEGLLSAADVAASRQAHVDPSFQYRDLTLDAAWGRRLD